MKDFNSLSEQEILALAISLEEEDERVYSDISEGLRRDFPASSAVFDGMRLEESGHRRRLIDLYRVKFGDHIPSHPPPPRRARICPAQARLAGAASASQASAQPRRGHGRGNPAIL